MYNNSMIFLKKTNGKFHMITLGGGTSLLHVFNFMRENDLLKKDDLTTSDLQLDYPYQMEIFEVSESDIGFIVVRDYEYQGTTPFLMIDAYKATVKHLLNFGEAKTEQINGAKQVYTDLDSFSEKCAELLKDYISPNCISVLQQTNKLDADFVPF